MKAAASRPEADPAASLAAWFAEFRRLAAEAEERFAAGELRPAITSLAAVPMIHHILVEGCGELTDGTHDDDTDPPGGLYL
jgi:hypothetical protein